MIFKYPNLTIDPMTCVMVDGSFDPLHDGHIEYFRAAAEFGFPVFCNVAPDEWTAKKHSVFLEQSKRALVLDSIRFLQFVMIGCASTASAIQAVKPRIFVKGDDWLRRGGVPQDERSACASLGVEIRYLDTVRNSSTRLLSRITEDGL